MVHFNDIKISRKRYLPTYSNTTMIKKNYCCMLHTQAIFEGENRYRKIGFLHYILTNLGTLCHLLLQVHYIHIITYYSSTVWMRKLRFEELKFSCHVVNEESTPVNLKGTAEGKIFWEKKIFYFLVFLNAFKALSFTCSRTQSRH